MFLRLLKIESSTCAPCRTLTKTLEEAGITDYEVLNIDKNPETIQIFNIRSVPTLLLVDEYNKDVARLIGLKNKNEILEWLSENG